MRQGIVTRGEARNKAISHGVDFRKEYRDQTKAAVSYLAVLAKQYGYRKEPPLAGSVARCFYYHLKRRD